ncbi:MAG: hypothetical protein HY912_05110 [Desulfomonile tiedjei]|uniref:DUF4347 domain-containing protein n=1 Tax=Desulfomonile tiedjei TaxID=2358 RepID=A0A9D6UZS4_9BACT|nr:hypothetical protein [Desulfomonile tiedjei]
MRSVAVLALLAAMMLGPDVSMSIGTPVPGYSGWTYSVSGGYNWYFYNDLGRFAYQNSTGVWYNFDKFGANKWRILSAAGASSSYLFDGASHDLRNGWWYAYDSSGQTAFWLKGTTGRFGYNFAIGRWYDFDPLRANGSWWQTLSAQCRSVIFVGSGSLTDLGTGWGFRYDYANDSGLWAVNSAARYAYSYTKKQWTDYTTQGWAALNRSGTRSSAFIGNGLWYQFSTGDYFHGDGNSYYWYSGGHDQYRYDFASGSWSYWSGANWYSMTYYANMDCRYLYNATFVERGLGNDTGTYAPAGRQELKYTVYDYSSGTFVEVTSWTIHNPGTDKKWSGGDLNVAWGNTRHWDSGTSQYINDFGARYGEFTKDDVLFFAADFEQSPIGFAAVVDWMTLVRDYYGKQIRTVQVAAHGSTNSWDIGETIHQYNYYSFQTDWQRWGGLMTSDGQIVSIHCQVGNYTPMLDAIAGWSGCDIFANTNVTWTHWLWLVGSDENTSYWNYNYNDVTWYDNSSTYVSRWFEYTTTGSQNYRWLFSL